ncbi:MAG: transposase [Methanogenium sp.]|nr:transposase [Methanogenium sp.]
MYLKDELLIPFEKTATYFKDKYSQQISSATIQNIRREAYESLDSYQSEIEEKLIQSPVLHADETGLRVIGKLWWLHTIGNERLTSYGVYPHRGSKAVDAMEIIPNYNGILVHDCWPTYFMYDCQHALCNAHIMRELEGIVGGYKQE